MADVIQLGPVQGLVNILWSRESELPALPSLQKSFTTTKHVGLSLPCKLGKAYFLFFSLRTVLRFARSVFLFFFQMAILLICFSLSKATW